MSCCFRLKKKEETNIDDNLKINKKDVSILYVEDCDIYMPLMKFIFEKYLKNINLKIELKNNINDAYDYIKNNNVDLIFLDRELNNEEIGDTLIGMLINEEIYDITKIIIISAIDNLDDIQTFLDMGVYYFKKPLDVPLFIKKIENIFI